MRVLLVEDDPADAELLELELRREGIVLSLRRVVDEEGFLQALELFRPHAILSDYTLPRFSGRDAIRIARELAPEVPFLVVTGTIGEEAAVECMKLGAWDYVIKGRMARLPVALTQAVDLAAERQRAREIEAELRRSETLAAIGALVSGVAHEVRNPLFSITATIDALVSRFGEREEYRRHIEVLRSEVDRLSHLMRDLLDYGRPLQLERAPRGPRELVTRAVALCEAAAQDRKVAVRVWPLELPQVAVDGERMVQVLQNVVDNAIRFSPPGSEVEVEGESSEHGVTVSIRDRGPGFRAEDRERLGQPFFSRRPGGTGLGLAIVRRIVEGHGGRVSLENHAEGGAVVRIELDATTPVPSPGGRAGGAREARP